MQYDDKINYGQNLVGSIYIWTMALWYTKQENLVPFWLCDTENVEFQPGDEMWLSQLPTQWLQQQFLGEVGIDVHFCGCRITTHNVAYIATYAELSGVLGAVFIEGYCDQPLHFAVSGGFYVIAQLGQCVTEVI